MFGGGLGIGEVIVIGMIAVLLFGKRLPEVARSVGKSYREFRGGFQQIQSGLDVSSYSDPSSSGYSPSTTYDDVDDHDEATAPKFEPPPSEPTESATDSNEPTESATDLNEPSATDKPAS